MANFTMAFKTESLMSMIYKSQYNDWPTGETHLVVTKLLEKYQPQYKVSSIVMQQELAHLQMKHSENPSRVFEQFCWIKNQYSKNMSNDEKMTQVVAKVT